MNRVIRVLLVSLLLRLLLVTGASAHQDPAYTLIDLGVVNVAGVDENGVALGNWRDQAALFYPEPVLLGNLPGALFSEAFGRDPRIGTVGESGPSAPSYARRAFLRRGGVLRELGKLGGQELYASATGISAEGVIGLAETPTHVFVAVIWPLQGGRPHVLPTLGGPGGNPRAIVGNVIVGNSVTATQEIHATMWIAGLPYDLTPGPGHQSFANGVNRSLTVVGRSESRAWGLADHAWRWTPQRGSEALQTPLGWGDSELLAVNDAGVAVGEYHFPGQNPITPGRAMRLIGTQFEDLTDLVQAPGWVLEGAVGINDQGVIVGAGALYGQFHAFMLRPRTQRIAGR
jgi:hypothetical protein